MQESRVCMIAIGVLTLCFLILSSCTWDEVKLALRFNPQEGETYHVDFLADQEIQQVYSGEDMAIHQRLGCGFTITVTEVDQSGNSWCEYVYDSVLFELDDGQNVTKLDSSDPPSDDTPAAITFGALLGKGFAVKQTPDGRILEVDGVQELIQQILDSLDIDDEEKLQEIEALLNDQFNEESLTNMVGEIVINYPEGEVEIGDVWTSTRRYNMMTPMIVESSWDLQDYDSGVADVRVESKVSTDPDAKTINMGSYEMRISLSGEQQGVYKIDADTGLSLSGSVSQTFSGDIIAMSDDAEQVIPITVDSKVTFEMTKGHPAN